MSQLRLILGVVASREQALRLQGALEEIGVEAFVTVRPWRGRERAMVGHHAANSGDALLLQDLLDRLEIEGEVLKDDLPDDDRLVVLCETPTQHDALWLCNLLEQNGVDSMATADEAQHALGGESIRPRVVIRAGDQEAALRVLRRAEELREEKVAEAASFEEEPAAWPECPQCQKPRETTCPKCKTTGSEMPRPEYPEGFVEESAPSPKSKESPPSEGEERAPPPEAEEKPPPHSEESAPPEAEEKSPLSESEESSPALVEGAAMSAICPLCDWLFAPEFYRRCAWCGHDFGSGIEIESSRSLDQTERLNPRVISVALGLLALMLGLAVYFAFVAS